MQKRKLGLTEYYSKFCHDHANGTTLLSCMIKIQGPLTSNMVEEALNIIQKRHSILRSYFAESTMKWDYIAVDETNEALPLSIVKRESDVHWKDVIERSSMTLFSEKDRYLWRVVFLEGSSGPSGEHEIVATFHHAISDGISVDVFLGEFMDYCSLIFNKAESPKMDVLPLLPPVEELLTKKISWGGFLLNMITSSGKYIKYRKYLDRFEQYVPLAERRHRNVYRELDDIRALNLLALCKDNNTTPTALLSAALTKAVYNVKNNSGKKAVQLLVTPVNVRERCNPVVARHRIGCYVDFIESTLFLDNDSSLWELSRSFRKQLMDGIEFGGHMPTNYSKSLTMSVFSSMGKGMFKEVFQYGLGVTNVGKVHLKARYGPFTIKYFSFCTGRQWGDWMILLHTATIKDKMYLCFCFSEPLISQKTVNLIADHVIDLLSSLDVKAKGRLMIQEMKLSQNLVP